MQLTLLHGYPDFVGRRQILCGYGTGPKSNVQLASGGDVVTIPTFKQVVDILFPALTLSGTYIAYPFPTATGPRKTWAIKWVTASSGAEVGAGVDLSGESIQLGGFGGVY
jgi:hypothetical protein